MKLLSTREKINRRAVLLAAGASLLPIRGRASTLSPEQALLHHTREIERILREAMPEGSWLRGFQFACRDNELDEDTIWASAITSRYQLAHARPAMFSGWREKTVQFAGEVN